MRNTVIRTLTLDGEIETIRKKDPESFPTLLFRGNELLCKIEFKKEDAIENRLAQSLSKLFSTPEELSAHG